MPWITAGQAAKFGADQEMFTAITNAAFAPESEVYLPLELSSEFPVPKPTRATVRDVKWTPHEITAVVEAAEPSMVVLSQSFYHAWKAELDGQPVELWRANYAFTALKTSAGKHQLRLYYRDDVFRVGLVTALVCLALLAAIGWRYSKRP